MNDTVFTDEQVTSACNLHIDNLRRLITWGAVRPIQTGGGRGRVRLWNFGQAMRVAATAEFFQAGFSLQMAHTLTYCLPLDDMLRLYDPTFIREHVNVDDPTMKHIKRLISRRSRNYWMPETMAGSSVVILNRQLMYADVLDSILNLYGIIDETKNIVHPIYDPKRLYWGYISENIGRPLSEPASSQISPSSLLIEKKYFELSDGDLLIHRLDLLKNIDTQIDDPDDFLYRNYQKINLNVGLVMAFRNLMGLPVAYPTIAEELLDG